MLDAAFRQFAEPPRAPGDSVALPTPASPTPQDVSIGVVDRADGPTRRVSTPWSRGVSIKHGGEAGLDHGNDFAGHPQLGMEMRDWRETTFASSAASGAVLIDVALAPVWYLALAGDAVLTLADPAPIPADQLAAGRNRNRAVGLILYLIRNGHGCTMPRAYYPQGIVEPPASGSVLEVWSYQWIGGPGVTPFWAAFPCGSKFLLAGGA